MYNYSKGPSCTLLVPGQFQVCNRNCSESLEWIAAGATVESSFFLFAFLCSRTCSFWFLFLFLFQLFLVFVVLVPIQYYFLFICVFFFSFSVLLSLLSWLSICGKGGMMQTWYLLVSGERPVWSCSAPFHSMNLGAGKSLTEQNNNCERCLCIILKFLQRHDSSVLFAWPGSSNIEA